jgi:hypothetical protein
MEPSIEAPKTDTSAEAELSVEEKDSIKVFHIDIMLHVASRRARKLYIIEQTLTSLIEFALTSSEVEVHWLEAETKKSTCSPWRRHSDTIVTFEYADSALVAEQLTTELRAIADSIYVTCGAVKVYDVAVTNP